MSAGRGSLRRPGTPASGRVLQPSRVHGSEPSRRAFGTAGLGPATPGSEARAPARARTRVPVRPSGGTGSATPFGSGRPQQNDQLPDYREFPSVGAGLGQATRRTLPGETATERQRSVCRVPSFDRGQHSLGACGSEGCGCQPSRVSSAVLLQGPVVCARPWCSCSARPSWPQRRHLNHHPFASCSASPRLGRTMIRRRSLQV